MCFYFASVCGLISILCNVFIINIVTSRFARTRRNILHQWILDTYLQGELGCVVILKGNNMSNWHQRKNWASQRNKIALYNNLPPIIIAYKSVSIGTKYSKLIEIIWFGRFDSDYFILYPLMAGGFTVRSWHVAAPVPPSLCHRYGPSNDKWH